MIDPNDIVNPTVGQVLVGKTVVSSRGKNGIFNETLEGESFKIITSKHNNVQQ